LQNVSQATGGAANCFLFNSESFLLTKVRIDEIMFTNRALGRIKAPWPQQERWFLLPLFRESG
jgi:hypothetical protein